MKFDLTALTLFIAALVLAGCKSPVTTTLPDCATYDGIGCAQTPTYTKPAPPIPCPDCGNPPPPPNPPATITPAAPDET